MGDVNNHNKIKEMYRPLWIEVDLRSLRHNFRQIQKIAGKCAGVMPMLKQEAYGHGLLPLARELSRCGAGWFGLGDLKEGIALRRHGFRERILVLSTIMPGFAAECVRYNITPTVIDTAFAAALNSCARRKRRRFPVHIKVDTGMGRLGVWHEQAASFIEEIASFKNLSLEGIFTHFPVADTDRRFTRTQIQIFSALIKTLAKRGIIFRYTHCANSAGILNYKEARYNLVRPGLVLYGIGSAKVKPVLSLKSRVIYVKAIKRGRSVSYGRTFIARRPTTVATIAVGYADGYPWNLSNKAKVLIHGRLCPLIGRVCMDHIMADTGKRSTKAGDEVILIGKSRNKEITARQVARWAGTIPYEVVSRLSLKIPRIYKYPSRK